MPGQYEMVECSRLNPAGRPARLMLGACVKRWRVAEGEMVAGLGVASTIRNSPCKGCPEGQKRSGEVDYVYGNAPAKVARCETPTCNNIVVGPGHKRLCVDCATPSRAGMNRAARAAIAEKEAPWPAPKPMGRPADLVELPEREYRPEPAEELPPAEFEVSPAGADDEDDEPELPRYRANASPFSTSDQVPKQEEPAAEPAQEDDMPTPPAPPGPPLRPAPPNGVQPSPEDLVRDLHRMVGPAPPEPALDPEVAAMDAVVNALEQLDYAARERVIAWSRKRYLEST